VSGPKTGLLEMLTKWRGVAEIMFVVITLVTAWNHLSARIDAHEIVTQRLEREHGDRFVERAVESAHYQEVIRRLERIERLLDKTH